MGLCSTSERYGGELGVRCLSTLREDRTLLNCLILVYPSYHYWFAPCTNTALIVDHYWFEAPLSSDASNNLRKYFGLHHMIPPKSIVLFQSKTNQILVSLPWTSTKRLGIGLHLSRKSIPIY